MSVVPVRATHSDKAEMTTQLLFGEIFTILQTSENQKWLEIHIYHDNYVGWIDILQCTFVSEKYFKEYARRQANHKIFCGYTSLIQQKSTSRNYPIMITKGAVIPFLKPFKGEIYEDFTIDRGIYSSVGLVFYDKVKETNNNFLRNKTIKNAFEYLHTPYLWGGRSVFGIDCSGLIQQVFRSVGYYLPRDAYQQAEEGKLVNFDAKKQGDLAFFIRENKIIHVGIVLEDNKIIHARGQVRIDTLTETGILNENTNEYSHYLAFLKRIL